MKKLCYFTLIITTLFLCHCSTQNGENGYSINPCNISEQGIAITETYNNNSQDFNLHFDENKVVVQYVTGHPQGNYYHIYSINSSPFIDFYTFAISTGNTSTLDQNWNITAGSYLAIDGSPFPQNNTITLNTLIGGTQAGDTVKITMNGNFSTELTNVTLYVEMCATIDEVVNLAEYVYVTDGTDLKIINVSNPLAPNLEHSISAETSYYVNTFNSVAYIGYFDATQPFVSFVNIANPPTASIFGAIPKGSEYGRVSDVIQVDNYTYISDEYKGFHKLHIANTNYTRIDNNDAMSMTKLGNDLSIINQTYGLHKIDVTNASAPVITNNGNLSDVDIASYPHTSGSFHSWVRNNDTNLYVVNINDKKLKKFQSSTYSLTSEVDINGYATALFIEGNYAFITTRASALAPLQISFDGITIVNLTTMTVIDSKPLNNASGVVVKANYAYVTDANGLHIYDISSSFLNLVNTYNNGFGNFISL